MADQRGVAGYYRVSVARDDMKAPELYSDEITRYCGYRDLVVKEIFSDIDYSGYNNSEKRPALNELVRRRHEFSAVIVPKLSRFGRSLKHLTPSSTPSTPMASRSCFWISAWIRAQARAGSCATSWRHLPNTNQMFEPTTPAPISAS